MPTLRAALSDRFSSLESTDRVVPYSTGTIVPWALAYHVYQSIHQLVTITVFCFLSVVAVSQDS